MVFPKCSIIVLAWNNETDLNANLPFLLTLDYPDYEILVVDNGSVDQTRSVVEQFAASSPPGRLRLLSLRKNWGYSRGKNTGARFAQGKYLWLLDADIRVQPDSLAYLVEFMENGAEERRAAMPVIREIENAARLHSAGLPFTFHGPCINVSHARWPQSAAPYSIHAPAGGVLFISKSYWEELGGFDPRAPFHLDDVDLGARIWTSGGSCWCVPQAIASHPAFRGSRLQADRRRWEYHWQFQNGPIFILRNFEWKTALFMLPACLAVQWMQVVKVMLSTGDWTMPWICLNAWRAVGHSLRRTLRMRAKIQSLRRRRDAEFLYTRNFWHL